jgi:hypothetical protein
LGRNRGKVPGGGDRVNGEEGDIQAGGVRKDVQDPDRDRGIRMGEQSAKELLTANDFPIEKKIYIELVTTRKTMEIDSEDYRIMLGLSQMKTVGEISRENKIPEKRVYGVLRSKDFNDWFYDKIQLAAMESGWTHGKIIKEFTDIYEGAVVKDKTQIEALKSIKDLVVDRARKTAEKNSTPVININFEAAKAALDRQKVIEAKVLNEPRHSATGLSAKS